MTWRLRLAVVALCGVLAVSGWALAQMYLAVSVAGGSMAPALRPADVVFVRRGAVEEAGQIALLRTRSGSLVLHRAVRVSQSGAVSTKGDANEVVDREVTPPARIVGRVAAVIPAGSLLARWRRTGVYATLTAQQNSVR